MTTGYRQTVTAIENPACLNDIEDRLIYYSNGKFDAVIYRFGTCVFLPAGINMLEGGANRLEELSRYRLNFTVREMDDRNFIVGYTDKIFSIVFHTEFEKLRDKIAREIENS
jgi:hypothetical protein